MSMDISSSGRRGGGLDGGCNITAFFPNNVLERIQRTSPAENAGGPCETGGRIVILRNATHRRSMALAVGLTLSLGASLFAAPGRRKTPPRRQLAAADSSASGSALDRVMAIPACKILITDAVISDLKTLPTDPLVTFENWRRLHRTTLVVSPLVNCRHLAWLALQSPPSAAAGLEAAAPQEVSPEAAKRLGASIGSNLAPAGGVDEYQGETNIAVNPANPLELVAGSNTFYADPTSACHSPTGGSSNTFGTQALFGSSDGGATWAYHCAPWPSGITGGVTNAFAWFGSDPTLAWDASGNAYATYMLISQNAANQAGVAIVVAQSTDSGQSWSPLGTVVNNISSTTNFDDKCMMAVDTTSGGAHSHTGRLYVVWDENNVERVAYSDTGTSWTTVVVDPGQVNIGGDVKVGADGTVYAIWNRLTFLVNHQTGESTVFSASTDGGATWSSPVTVATHRLFSFGGNNFPPAQDQRGINAFGSLGVDTNSASAYFGRLYVTYADFPLGTTTGTNVNTYVARSTNNGASWSSVLVNDDGTTSPTQFFPWLAVDQSDGTVNVAWYDTRNFSGSGNKKTQVFYSRSSDGGATFEPNQLVTDGGANFVNHLNYSDESSADNGNYNPNQYGDYMGIAALNRSVHPYWTDSRQFYTTAGDARVEDTATAAITNCSPPVWAAAPTAACAGSSISIAWTAPSWGTNATSGTYAVYRYTDAACSMNQTLVASGLSTTGAADAAAVPGTSYYYDVVATNNCPGTALTPMTATSACSNAATRIAPPTAGNNGPICAGDTLQLTASTISGASYSWTGPKSFTSTDQNPQILSAPASASGTYSVTATLSGCTSPAATTDVVVHGLPSAQIAAPLDVCPDSTGNLASVADAGAGATYAWVVTNGTIASGTGTRTITFTAGSTGSVDLSVTVTDGNGCMASGSQSSTITVNCAADFYTVSPCRAIDTRNAAGPYGGPALAANADRTFVLTGQCNVPAGARAVSVNVTITQSSAAGDLRLYPTGALLPLVSTINYVKGQTRANNAVVALDDSGQFTVHCDQASGTVQFIVDVNGYFQ
jgi:PKD-like domain